MDDYHLKIARIEFSISSPLPIFPESTKPVYAEFFSPRDGDYPKDISVQLLLEKFPSGQRQDEVFNSGQSWSMHQGESEYHIHFDPRQDGSDPYWQARFNSECTEVNIHCSGELIIHAGEQSWIKNPVQYPLDQLLTVYHIAQRSGALVHAAGALIHGRGILLPGRSGAGKSTITRQLTAEERGFELLSDDRVIVRKIDDRYSMFGTPWPGEAGIAKNVSAPVHRIAFIHHGTRNTLTEIEPKKALQQLLPVVSIPWYDQAIMPRLVEFCEGLVNSLPAYDLHFKPSMEIAGFLEEFLAEQVDSK